MSKDFRAYDALTEWIGPARETVDEALWDGQGHVDGSKKQGGFAVACVIKRSGDRCQYLDGSPVWPSHGRSTGAVRWPEDPKAKTPRLRTYHVVCLYRVTLEQYVDEVEAKTPAEARHQAQLNAIHNNARPVPTESELATILAAGKETGWDFEEPALREYSEFALDHAATYQVVEPGTLDSETLKLVE